MQKTSRIRPLQSASKKVQIASYASWQEGYRSVLDLEVILDDQADDSVYSFGH